MAEAIPLLPEILRRAVVSTGYEFVGHEFVGQGPDRILRVYIESQAGIGADDCQKVSRQIELTLEVEEPPPIAGAYRLEVSSPGMERPLFTLDHYRRFTGEQVQLKLRPQGESKARRRYSGQLVAVEDKDIILQVDSEQVRLSFLQIESAKLKVDWSKKQF